MSTKIRSRATELKSPNKTTVRTIRKTEAGKEVVSSKDTKELFRKLGISG